jgi:hypothetical protein
MYGDPIDRVDRLGDYGAVRLQPAAEFEPTIRHQDLLKSNSE